MPSPTWTEQSTSASPMASRSPPLHGFPPEPTSRPTPSAPATPCYSLDPPPGTARSVELDKRHRLLRRGREYGPPVPPESVYAEPPADDPERGLFFICIGASIGRQFEFVQHSWVNNPKFAELYDEPDPLVGYHPPGASNFSIPTDPVRLRLRNVPQFVTTRGGAYFFLP